MQAVMFSWNQLLTRGTHSFIFKTRHKMNLKCTEVTHISYFWGPWSFKNCLIVLALSCIPLEDLPGDVLIKKGHFAAGQVHKNSVKSLVLCSGDFCFPLQVPTPRAFSSPYSVLDSELLLKREAVFPSISTAFHTLHWVYFIYSTKLMETIFEQCILDSKHSTSLNSTPESKLQPRVQSNGFPYSLLLECTLRRTFKVISEYALYITPCTKGDGITWVKKIIYQILHLQANHQVLGKTAESHKSLSSTKYLAYIACVFIPAGPC